MDGNGELRGIVERAIAGDANAAAGIYERYADRVRAFASQRLTRPLRRDFDSVDLLQSAFVQVLRDLPHFVFQGEPPFLAWLRCIVVGKICTKYRRLQRRELAGCRVDLEEVSDPRESRCPIGVSQKSEDVARARRVMRELGGIDQAVIRIRLEEGVTYGEIARRVGLESADAARKRYKRALIELRRRCKTND